MPYMKVRNGPDDKPVCVYKKDADGKPEGESLGCHENEEKADAQIAAIGAQSHMSLTDEDRTALTPDLRQSILTALQGHTYHTDKMARCIGHLEGKGFSPESAHRICYSVLGDEANVSMTQFLFTELTATALTPGKAFDALAPGKFTDMRSQPVEISAEDLPTFLANTQRAIAATKSESGEVVGLPIDARNHEKGDAGGWIIGVELAGKVLRFIPRWTDIGVELISKGVQRFFSATLDLKNKVILGGTLTNWPATRDPQGNVLLRPIELSQTLYALQDESLDERAMKIRQAFMSAHIMPMDDMPIVVEVFDDYVICRAGEKIYRAPFTESEGGYQFAARDQWQEVKPAYVDAARQWFTELVKRLFQKDEGVLDMQITPEQLQRMITDGVAAALKKDMPLSAPPADLAQFQKAISDKVDLAFREQLAQMTRVHETTELAQALTGGTVEAPRGLKGVTGADLAKHLLAIPAEEAVFFSGLLKTVIAGDGLIEFGEVGHGRRLQTKQPVPDYAAKYLREAIAAGHTAEQFFELAGLGKADEYDLAPFEKKNGQGA